MGLIICCFFEMGWCILIERDWGFVEYCGDIKRKTMKIRIEIVERAEEPSCVIQTPALNDRIYKLMDYIKKLDAQVSDFVTAYDGEREKTVILKPEELFMICIESKKVYISQIVK